MRSLKAYVSGSVVNSLEKNWARSKLRGRNHLIGNDYLIVGYRDLRLQMILLNYITCKWAPTLSTSANGHTLF